MFPTKWSRLGLANECYECLIWPSCSWYYSCWYSILSGIPADVFGETISGRDIFAYDIPDWYFLGRLFLGGIFLLVIFHIDIFEETISGQHMHADDIPHWCICGDYFWAGYFCWWYSTLIYLRRLFLGRTVLDNWSSCPNLIDSLPGWIVAKTRRVCSTHMSSWQLLMRDKYSNAIW